MFPRAFKWARKRTQRLIFFGVDEASLVRVRMLIYSLHCHVSLETTKEEKSHPMISNDELLYDPDADDIDQNWVDQQHNNNNRY